MRALRRRIADVLDWCSDKTDPYGDLEGPLRRLSNWFFSLSSIVYDADERLKDHNDRAIGKSATMASLNDAMKKAYPPETTERVLSGRGHL